MKQSLPSHGRTCTPSPTASALLVVLQECPQRLPGFVSMQLRDAARSCHLCNSVWGHLQSSPWTNRRTWLRVCNDCQQGCCGLQGACCLPAEKRTPTPPHCNCVCSLQQRFIYFSVCLCKRNSKAFLILCVCVYPVQQHQQAGPCWCVCFHSEVIV